MEETTPQTNSSTSATKFLIPIAVVIIIIGIVVFASSSRKKEDAAVVNKTEESSSPIGETMQKPQADEDTQSPDNNSTDEYTDGTYSATGNYVSPGGAEELGVQITLKDGVITAAEVDPKATRPNSVKFQGIFVSNYKSLVIGKNIDDVELTTVSGSSLSPKGFNEALAEIKAQAKS